MYLPDVTDTSGDLSTESPKEDYLAKAKEELLRFKDENFKGKDAIRYLRTAADALDPNPEACFILGVLFRFAGKKGSDQYLIQAKLKGFNLASEDPGKEAAEKKTTPVRANGQ